MNRFVPYTLAMALVAAGCGPVVLQHRVPPEAVKNFPTKATTAITKAQSDLSVAKSDLIKARQALKDARYKALYAENELSLTEDRIKLISDLEDLVVELDDAVKTEELGAQRTAINALREAQAQEVKWRRLLRDHAEVTVELTEARVLAADANVESARSEGLQMTESPLKDSIRVSDYKLQGANMLEKVPPLETQAAEIWAEVERTRAEYDRLATSIPRSAAPNYQALVTAEDKAKVVAQQLTEAQNRLEHLSAENEVLRSENRDMTTRLGNVEQQLAQARAETEAIKAARTMTPPAQAPIPAAKQVPAPTPETKKAPEKKPAPTPPATQESGGQKLSPQKDQPSETSSASEGQ